MALVHAVEEAR
uniref:Uncharacterized protein n=1 Tax=Arundo donax TaxID=35708 RepID=A0A0A9FT23_ARUDO